MNSPLSPVSTLVKVAEEVVQLKYSIQSNLDKGYLGIAAARSKAGCTVLLIPETWPCDETNVEKMLYQWCGGNRLALKSAMEARQSFLNVIRLIEPLIAAEREIKLVAELEAF